MLCLIRNNSCPIKNFSIFGERHSGTNFLEKLIQQTFGISPTWNCGWKHFFGYNNPCIIKSKNTLFIGIVRNPYDWIMAMKKRPHHAPNDNIISSQKLLLGEWYSVDSKRQEILEDRNFITKQRYKNIFELRKTKMTYLLYKAPLICNNYLLIRYEDLLTSSNYILDIIQYQYGFHNRYRHNVRIIQKNSYTIPDFIKTIIDSNMDWDTEAKFGFHKKS